MAVNEILLSFSDHIKKSRNPFFGTLIVVWIIRNWQFLVTLFNLDLYPTMEQKVDALKSYFADDTIIKSFFITAGITLLVLIVTYLLLNVTRFISNIFEKIVTPWVYKITDRSSIVLKSDFHSLEKERNQLEVLRLGLIQVDERLTVYSDPTKYHYKLTEKGKGYWDFLVNENIGNRPQDSNLKEEEKF